ncbi:hypothetical protein KBC75_01320 [Candidatus Shapirobacteria bacterium]|nr:hypothetical protein [Candidatus Shapirobacteria bacterium]
MINKLSILLQQPQKIFHTADLRILWGIYNQNTLRQTVSRYTQKKSLFRIYKGVYSTIDPQKLDTTELGYRLFNRYCYLTTETVLSQNGLINHSPTKITFVSSLSQNIILNQHTFLSRQLKSQYLHNTAGITQLPNGVLIASSARAVADLLYFQPNFHFDAGSIINWDQVKQIQQEVYSQ